MHRRRDHWWTKVLTLLAFACAGCVPVVSQSREDQRVQPRVVLIIHKGEAGIAQVRDDVQEVVAAAAHGGARLEVYALDGGSAASMPQVPLSDEANKGNLVLTGANQGYRDREALRYIDLVMHDLDPLFDKVVSSATGSDVIGAVDFGVAAVLRLPGAGPATVSVVTGGGVHRTRGLDLVAAGASPENAARVAAEMEPLVVPADVVVEFRGVGRFEGATPQVDPQFAAAVRTFWEVLCPRCVLR